MSGGFWKWLKLGGFLLGLAAVVALLQASGVRWADLRPEQVRVTVHAYGWWAPLIYIGMFAQPLVPLPASVMAMAGGLSFGLIGGFLAALTGAVGRAYGQFALAKLFGREAIEGLLRGRLATFDRRVEQSGFLAVLLVRIVPNVPFDLQNFGLGFSRIGFGPYAAATFLGLVPTIFLWTYLGYTVTDPRQLWKVGLALIGLAALVALRFAIAHGAFPKLQTGVQQPAADRPLP